MSTPRRDDLRFTQNFLHDAALVARLVKQAQLTAGGVVLEVGPGKGIITSSLADAVGPQGQVIAVELDERLAAALTGQFAARPQVKVMIGDILDYDFGALGRTYAVFANVPFNITSALLERMLDPRVGPAQAHLILQRDTFIAVGEGGAPALTLKALMVHPWYDVREVYRFRPSDFRPAPSVETALFALARRPEPLLDSAHHALYLDFLAVVSKDRAGEGGWRKLFSGPQLALLLEHGLVMGRGLKAQPAGAMLAAFRLFAQANRARFGLVQGAMANLRAEQQRREAINRAGGHHRSNQTPRKPPRR
jgi:16S rRNA A1518/A1519 N6-dimethyltransferase RsmA/KsgA/DIM1 with predicted DNA glycosylase/AP lyase activity